MLTLYHAPLSRSSRIVRLLEELGARDRVEIRTVDISRRDGSGGHDPDNPHPEGKVPLLVHDGVQVRESNAIILYLTDLFPEAGLAPRIGDPARGTYLSLLAYYGNVMEPVLVLQVAGLAHPVLTVTLRGVPEMEARLAEALAGRDFLLGDRFSAADLLLVSPFVWFPEAMPAAPAIRAWVARCEARPSAARTTEFDAALIAARS